MHVVTEQQLVVGKYVNILSKVSISRFAASQYNPHDIASPNGYAPRKHLRTFASSNIGNRSLSANGASKTNFLKCCNGGQTATNDPKPLTKCKPMLILKF